MREVIVKTSKIYDGKIVKLDVHEVRLPSDEFAKREQIRHPGASAVVAVDDNGEVLLVRQFRLSADNVLLEIPAGTLDPGEDPAECAARELQEEAGHKPGKLDYLGGFFVAPGYTTEYIHLYLGTELTESRLEHDFDESFELVRVPLAEAVRMALEGEIVDSKSIIGLLKVARRYGI